MTRERLGCKRCEVLLESYLDGELGARLAALVESHLGGCFACQQELAHARRVGATLRALPERFCPEGVVERVRERARQAAAPAPGPRGLAARLGGWFGGAGAHAWRPAVAALGVAVVVFGVVRIVRPPAEQSISPADVVRAEAQVRWVMARLGDINRRTGAKVQQDVLQARIVAPAARAVQGVLEGGTPQ